MKLTVRRDTILEAIVMQIRWVGGVGCGVLWCVGWGVVWCGMGWERGLIISHCIFVHVLHCNVMQHIIPPYVT